ncbi:hypothetical protein [Yersinia artesiana]|uniref:hypothetical protein n=1 Tax=Yersinia artesiana TaxID=2890315 RepID=UPI0015828426|nr:hypothetical protein [Yersinia artesiana]
MKKATKRILRSMGSILDICPSDDYKEFRNIPPDNELLNGDWISVGDYIKDSMRNYDSKKEPQTTHQN